MQKIKDKDKNKFNNKINNKNFFDFYLFVIVLILLVIGLTMVLSASSPSALRSTGSAYTYAIKQVVAAFIGLIGMFIFFKIDYKIYKKFYIWIGIISILILLLVLVPGLGREMNGAKRWINVPIITSLQPSEITKIGIIIALAGFFSINKDLLGKQKGFWIPLIFLGIISLILFVVQSHLSAIIIILIVGCTIMLTAGVKMRYFIGYGIPISTILRNNNL